ncbi:MAG: hypothetical protein HC921_08025 [Synechococcaceae cyanobacterium SM2_3_1]|nr:hypothetical protein [Synechococcaceae cyanobacterium SM2_3_1]
MGLQERKVIERVQNEELPSFNQRLLEYTSSPILFELDRESFQTNLDACFYLSGFLNTVANAVEWVSRQPVGKQALAEGINRIAIRNVADPAEKRCMIQDKVWYIDSVLSSTDSECRFGDSELIKYLEENL